MLQTDQQLSSVSSQTTGLKTNADSSVDIYFGPQAPRGFENNWIQTIPGNGLVRDLSPLWPAGIVVRQDMAPWRNRASEMMIRAA